MWQTKLKIGEKIPKFGRVYSAQKVVTSYINLFKILCSENKPKSSPPSGQTCNYVCDNENREDISTSIYNVNMA